MGMKKEIEQSVANVQSILARSELTGPERNVIMEELSKACYGKCIGNALLHAFNELFKEMCPEQYQEYLATYRKSLTFNVTFKNRMDEIWPYDERY